MLVIIEIECTIVETTDSSKVNVLIDAEGIYISEFYRQTKHNREILLLGVYFPRLAGVPESPEIPPPAGIRLPRAALGRRCLPSSS